jgi:hypothetical protein
VEVVLAVEQFWLQNILEMDVKQLVFSRNSLEMLTYQLEIKKYILNFLQFRLQMDFVLI